MFAGFDWFAHSNTDQDKKGSIGRNIQIVIVRHSLQLKAGIPETVIPPREGATGPLLTSTLYWTRRRVAKILRTAVRGAGPIVVWDAEVACELEKVQCKLLADLKKTGLIRYATITEPLFITPKLGGARRYQNRNHKYKKTHTKTP